MTNNELLTTCAWASEFLAETADDARPKIGEVVLAGKVQAVLTTRSLPAATRAETAAAIIRERVESAYKLGVVA